MDEVTRWVVGLAFEIDATNADEASEHAMDLVNQIEVEPHDVMFVNVETDGPFGTWSWQRLGPRSPG